MNVNSFYGVMQTRARTLAEVHDYLRNFQKIKQLVNVVVFLPEAGDRPGH